MTANFSKMCAHSEYKLHTSTFAIGVKFDVIEWNYSNLHWESYEITIDGSV